MSLHPRMSGEERRRQLIETAIDVFSQRGFAGATTREIATAAGVTEAIIFRHFATKQDLYKAILEYKCGGENSREWMAAAQTFMDQDDDEGLFRFLISAMLRFFRDEPKFERLLIHAALEGHELAIMHHDQMSSSLGAQFRSYIARRQSQGVLRPFDPALVLCALAGISQSYALKKYIYRSQSAACGGDFGPCAPTDEEVVENFLMILMGGLRPVEGKHE